MKLERSPQEGAERCLGMWREQWDTYKGMRAERKHRGVQGSIEDDESPGGKEEDSANEQFEVCRMNIQPFYQVLCIQR